MTPATQGALLALLSAACWGGGDFAGGMGARVEDAGTPGALRVIVTAYLLSLAALAAWLFLHHSLARNTPATLWALGSGSVAGLGVAAFYSALAQGEMGAAAAVSGLLAAAIPAVVGALLQGSPGPRAYTGFLLAAVSIWYIAAGPTGQGKHSASRTAMGLAIAGGLGFGLYFTGLKFANGLGVVEPLLLARIAGVAVCLILLALLRRPRQSSPVHTAWLSKKGWFWATGVALLDTAGNLFYLAATRAGRLDIAAVLAALYPASTILLAATLLHERPTTRQWCGMALAATAVILITL